MAMTGKELRDLRNQLNIPLRVIAQIIPYSISRISLFESGFSDSIKEDFVQKYEQFLADCIDGKVNLKKYQRKRKVRDRIPECLACSVEQVEKVRVIRKKLKISKTKAAHIIGVTLIPYSCKEERSVKMRTTEYEALMKFFKEEKLKQTFGNNYKEATK